MSRTKVVVALDQAILSKLDQFVKRKIFSSRSQAIQEAISEKIAVLEGSRLAIECAKLDPEEEKAFAELGMSKINSPRTSRPHSSY
jgi:Arc/MetJ-type ribon-helix-helix transcriptional regulator